MLQAVCVYCLNQKSGNPMKKILLIILVIIMKGCSNIDAIEVDAGKKKLHLKSINIWVKINVMK